MTRALIVNADDFGLTPGVNRGIAEAYDRGIVTATSLMVDEPHAEHAARLAGSRPGLEVGLHAVGTDLERQLARFRELVGRLPTHLDAHHHAHRDAALLPGFVRVAAEQGLPLREHADVPVIGRFYGRWGGESHPEQLTADSLIAIVEAELGVGVAELCCHPGYLDAHLRSSYRRERELELRTLCDPRVRAFLDDAGIALVGHGGRAPAR